MTIDNGLDSGQMSEIMKMDIDQLSAVNVVSNGRDMSEANINSDKVIGGTNSSGRKMSERMNSLSVPNIGDIKVTGEIGNNREMSEKMKLEALSVPTIDISKVTGECNNNNYSGREMSEKMDTDGNHLSVPNIDINDYSGHEMSEKIKMDIDGDEMSESNICNGKKSKGITSRSKVDGRWSWVVLTVTVIAAIISGGQLQSVNIYYLIFLEEFKQSSSYTAWISAAQGTALCVAGPLVSYLLPKLGARLTMIFGALLMATCYASIFFANSIPILIVVFSFIGASECMMSGGYMAAIASYFPRQSSFALGIMFAGGGLGLMVTGMQLEWSLEVFGWRGAMLVQAAIVLQICVCGCLVLRPLERQDRRDGIAEDKPASFAKTSLKSLSEDPYFWAFVVSFMAFSGQFSTMMTIFKGFVVSIDLESSFTVALTASSVGNMMGKVLGGPLSQLMPAPLHLTVVALASALTNALYVVVDEPWTLSVVAGSFGFCQGHMTIVWLLNVSWIYGPKEMPVVRGHIIFFGVICALSFPPIAGYTVDLTGSYAIAMIMSSACCIVIAICAMVTYVIHNRKSSVSNNSYDVTDDLKMSTLAPPCVQLVHYAPYVPNYVTNN